ncbi:P-loop NTPase fold protein [Streptomyces sp. NPDC007851]|uniref:P-loop NTPase fold protein n=1 Tax=Streptomyces sp. NPDC007851 TaxID=3155008 RepID=UPI0033C50019
MADSQLQPGMTATRAEIRTLYGGSSQGGIVPSNTSNSVLLYSDPTVGRRYGYRDGWLAEEDEHGPIFEYTGAGALGDQTFEGSGGSGNRAVLNHVEAGRSLRVFTATGTVPGSQTKLHRYVGEFKVDADRPYVLRQMPDSNGNQRKVIVFRLRPAGVVDRDGRDVIPPSVQTLTSLHSDSSTADDLLGNRAEVDKLSKLVMATTTMPPLAIALLGEWGAGKSSFMAQMNQRIQQLAKLSAQKKPSESAFVAHVRQIHFNAWHYSDEHVWSGLIEKLFRDLAQVSEERDDPSESVLAKRAERAAELGKLEHRSEQLDLDLEQAARLQPQGFLTWSSSPRQAWLLLRAASRELRADTTAYGLTALTVLAVAVAAIVWGRPMVQPWIAGSVGILLASPPIAKIWRAIRVWIPGQRNMLDKVRGRLEEIQADLHSKVTAAQASLAEVDAAVRLGDFLTERGSTTSYQGYRGLLAWVHKDLTHLDEKLRAAQDEWAESESNQPPPLQRIILYIDDLDRCPPARVVEVLAAVHLMLALPLFVVVVAVDPRWLVRCLKHHHKELFAEAGEIAKEEALDIATPIDYLDKIFQIPLTVPPVTPEKTALFLRALLDTPDTDGDPTNTEQTNPTPRSGDDAHNGDDSIESSSAIGEPAVPNVEADDLNPSQMTLTAPEISFIAQLGALVPTPRSAKKLVNLYRLVRMGIKTVDLQDFVSPSPSDPGEHQAVQVLLTLLVGHPEQARPLFKHILSATSSEKITDVLRNSPPQAAIGPSAADVLDTINATTEVRLDVATYQRWCPLLARYSFYTHHLSG